MPIKSMNKEAKLWHVVLVSFVFPCLVFFVMRFYNNSDSSKLQTITEIETLKKEKASIPYVDYKFEEINYFIEYVSFTPEVMLQLRPTAHLDILEEVNKAVYERVVDSLADNYMELLERTGLKQKEVA